MTADFCGQSRKKRNIRTIHNEYSLSELLMAILRARNIRIEEELVGSDPQFKREGLGSEFCCCLPSRHRKATRGLLIPKDKVTKLMAEMIRQRGQGEFVRKKFKQLGFTSSKKDARQLHNLPNQCRLHDLSTRKARFVGLSGRGTRSGTR